MILISNRDVVRKSIIFINLIIVINNHFTLLLQQERNFIMQVICDATQFDESHLKLVIDNLKKY